MKMKVTHKDEDMDEMLNQAILHIEVGDYKKKVEFFTGVVLYAFLAYRGKTVPKG